MSWKCVRREEVAKGRAGGEGRGVRERVKKLREGERMRGRVELARERKLLRERERERERGERVRQKEIRFFRIRL